MRVNRRDVLKGLGAAALLPGCRPAPPTGDAPSPIEHVLFTMMENRSFDHMLGSLSLEEGRLEVNGPDPDFGNPMPDGTLIKPFRTGAWCIDDPPHGWDDSRLQWANGDCSGFIQAYAKRWGEGIDLAQVMGYFAREQLPITYGLADRYALCQRWHASLMTDTWPNRLYAHGAQSQGMTTNDLPDGTFFSMETIWDRLDAAGISWAYYYSDLPMISLFGRFNTRPEIKPIENLFADLARGELATVVQIEPAFGANDDHPPHDPTLGQLFLSTLHAALAQSPLWEKLAWIVTYDENGGFFDHVSPPTAPDDRADQGFDQLGFRVPALVVGPYARRGLVSDVAFDHTSWLAHVEGMFGLPTLTKRDAAANDLWAVHDLDRIAQRLPLAPGVLPIISLSEQEILDQCDEGARTLRTGQIELANFVHRHCPQLDRRAHAGRTMRSVFEHATRLGALHLRP